MLIKRKRPLILIRLIKLIMTMFRLKRRVKSIHSNCLYPMGEVTILEFLSFQILIISRKPCLINQLWGFLMDQTHYVSAWQPPESHNKNQISWVKVPPPQKVTLSSLSRTSLSFVSRKCFWIWCSKIKPRPIRACNFIRRSTMCLIWAITPSKT